MMPLDTLTNTYDRYKINMNSVLLGITTDDTTKRELKGFCR